MLTTVGAFIKSVRRLTIVWTPRTTCAAVVTGSTVRQGYPACPLPSGDLYPQLVGTCHCGTRAIADPAAGKSRGDVQAEHGVGLRILERAFLNHLFRAPTLAGECGVEARAFFGRLEQEFDRSGQFVFHVGQHLGGGHQDCRMRIVPAGVHDVDLASEDICPWPLKRMKALPAP
jgi:hypothetical protein